MRLFTDLLRDMRAGESLEELTSALHNLVRSCVTTGSGGTITYQLTIKPMKSSGAVEITDKIDLKEPREQRNSSLFFVGPTFDLTRNNPRQEMLDLRSVDTSNPAPRDVSTGTDGGAQ